MHSLMDGMADADAAAADADGSGERGTVRQKKEQKERPSLNELEERARASQLHSSFGPVRIKLPFSSFSSFFFSWGITQHAHDSQLNCRPRYREHIIAATEMEHRAGR